MKDMQLTCRGKALKGEGWQDGWVYGYVYADESGTYIKPAEKNMRFGCGCPVDPGTVGLFSNQLDKDKKQIFDGDIIELIDAQDTVIHAICTYGIHQRTMQSGFKVDIPGFAFIILDPELPLVSFPIIENYQGKHDLDIISVIGNKWDNPDLLK